VCKLCTKSEQNRTIRQRVIDHLARFRCPVLGGGALSPDGSHGVRRPNFTKLGEDTGRTWPSYKFVSEFRCLAAFSNAGASKLNDVENDAKFHTL